jgi:hypothetical protein
VVPHSYATFFDAASQAAGALIGLLFVVIALSPGKMIGPHANVVSRRLAVSSFTGLVNAFFVSLLALIPGHHNIGYGASVVAATSLFHTLRLHLGARGAKHMVTFVASLLAYGIELGVAIAFIANPHNTELIDYLAFVLIGCFAVALNRAWQLLQSTAVGADVTVQTRQTP